MYKLDKLRNFKVHSFGNFDLNTWGKKDIILNDNIFNYDFLIVQESDDYNRHLYIADSIWLLSDKSIGDILYSNHSSYVTIKDNNVIYSENEKTRLDGVYGIKL